MSWSMVSAPSGAISIARVSTRGKASRRTRWLASAAVRAMVMGGILLTSPVYAAVTSWTVLFSGNWFTPVLWNNGVPAAADTANIPLGALGPSIGAPGAVATNIDLGARGFLRVDPGGTLVVSGTMQTHDFSNFTVDGGVATVGTLDAGGDVVVQGAGTVLNVTNFTVDATLTIGGGVAAGTLNAAIVNLATVNSDIDFSQLGSTIFTANITGVGTVTVTAGNPGTTILTGTNTYSGTTTISVNSTLQIGNGGTTGTLGSGNVVDNGTLVFNRSDNLTYGGGISGSGTVTKLGAGMLTLSGANNFSGGITVAAGTLSLGSNGAAGSGPITTTGSVIDYANGVSIANPIVVNSDTTSLQVTTGSATQGGVISETGGSRPIQKLGAGTLILSDNNTYSGPTTITAGTLQLGNGGTFGSVSGDIIDNGMLIFSKSGAGITLSSGTISGSGAVTVNDSSNLALQLTGANSYTGGTIVNSGTLRLVTDGNLASTGNVTINGGTFDLNGHTQTIGDLSGTGGALGLGSGVLTAGTSNSTSFAGVISGSGTVTKVGTGTLTLTGANIYSGGTTISAGTLQLGNGGTTGSITGNVVDNGVLAFNHSSASTFGGVISGSGGITQQGTGTTILTGANTYTGATVVNAGTLSVNGSIASSSAVTVTAGGSLGGTGTLPRTTINGGTLAPGNSIGTLSVNGSLTLASTATYAVEVSPSAADRTNVAGPATVAGSLQAIATGGIYTIGTQYTVLAATGGVSGKFSNLSIVGNFGVTRPRISYDANDVFLVLDPNAISPFLTNGTANQTRLAGAIDKGLAASNVDLIALFNLSATALPTALDQLTGEIHASVQSALVEDSRFARQAVMGRLAPSAGLMQAQAAEGPTEPAFWVQSFGSWGTFDGNGNAAATDRNIGGVFTGLDANLGMLRAGLAVGYSQADIGADARASTADIDTFLATAYGGARLDAWSLRLGGAYAWHNVKAHRVAAFSGFSDSDAAHYHSETGQLFGELGYTLTAGPVALEPYVGLDHVRVSTNPFAEKGGVAALTGARNNEDASDGTLGLRASSDQMLSGGQMLRLHGSVAWQYAFGEIVPSSVMAFASTGARFVVYGAPRTRESGLVDFGVELPFGPAVSLAVDYAGQFASHFHDNGVEGRFSYRF